MFTYFDFFFSQKIKNCCYLQIPQENKSKHSAHQFAFTSDSSEAFSHIVINSLYSFFVQIVFFNLYFSLRSGTERGKSTYDTDYYMKTMTPKKS